jgi:hypothetical protein
MFKFTIIKSKVKDNIKSKVKVLFFHGFGAQCYKYNLTQLNDKNDDIKGARESSYQRAEPSQGAEALAIIRTNNWLDNLVNVFDASELIYYDRKEENCLFQGVNSLSKAPNFHNHIVNLHKQLIKEIIKPDTKLYIVCHSLGCIYGLKFYTMFPQNIEGIVFLDSTQLNPHIIKIYLNDKCILHKNELDILKKKRIFTDAEKEKWIDFIFYDIISNFTNIDELYNKIDVKLLCFWNIDSNCSNNSKTKNNMTRQFIKIIKNKFMKNSKDNKNIELIDRDHYLNQTDDIKINKTIREFMIENS